MRAKWTGPRLVAPGELHEESVRMEVDSVPESPGEKKVSWSDVPSGEDEGSLPTHGTLSSGGCSNSTGVAKDPGLDDGSEDGLADLVEKEMRKDLNIRGAQGTPLTDACTARAGAVLLEGCSTVETVPKPGNVTPNSSWASSNVDSWTARVDCRFTDAVIIADIVETVGTSYTQALAAYKRSPTQIPISLSTGVPPWYAKAMSHAVILRWVAGCLLSGQVLDLHNDTLNKEVPRLVEYLARLSRLADVKESIRASNGDDLAAITAVAGRVGVTLGLTQWLREEHDLFFEFSDVQTKVGEDRMRLLGAGHLVSEFVREVFELHWKNMVESVAHGADKLRIASCLGHTKGVSPIDLVLARCHPATSLVYRAVARKRGSLATIKGPMRAYRTLMGKKTDRWAREVIGSTLPWVGKTIPIRLLVEVCGDDIPKIRAAILMVCINAGGSGGGPLDMEPLKFPFPVFAPHLGYRETSKPLELRKLRGQLVLVKVLEKLRRRGSGLPSLLPELGEALFRVMTNKDAVVANEMKFTKICRDYVLMKAQHRLPAPRLPLVTFPEVVVVNEARGAVYQAELNRVATERARSSRLGRLAPRVTYRSVRRRLAIEWGRSNVMGHVADGRRSFTVDETVNLLSMALEAPVPTDEEPEMSLLRLANLAGCDLSRYGPDCFSRGVWNITLPKEVAALLEDGFPGEAVDESLQVAGVFRNGRGDLGEMVKVGMTQRGRTLYHFKVFPSGAVVKAPDVKLANAVIGANAVVEHR